MSKIQKIGLGVAFIILLALAGLYFFMNKQNTKTRVQPQPKEAIVQKTNIDFSKLPAKFPTNIPIETGAKTTQNYNATTPAGLFQATRTFETKQTLAANLTLYTDFLKKDGWKIKGTTDNPTYKMVMGAKGKQSLLITINEMQTTKIKTVSISYSKTK